MYAKIKNDQLIKYPYGIVELLEDKPDLVDSNIDIFAGFEQTSDWSDGARLVHVTFQGVPNTFNSRTHKFLNSTVPELVGEKWMRVCVLTEKTAEELAQDNVFKAETMRAWRDQVLLTTSDRINPMRWEEMSEEQKQAQRTYRQGLLDLPQQAGFPWEVIWPDAP